MTQAIAYLNYDGRCAEAMRFYEHALGGRLVMLMTGGDSPMKDMIPPEARDRVIHARLALPGGGMLYAGDTPAGMPWNGVHGVGIAVDYDTVERAREVFAALAEGGQVTMPMEASFWARAFGMCVDRFGVPWMVNGEMQPM